MTAISILRAVVASAATPLKTDTGSEQPGPALESVFKGVLDDAIQSWVKGETKDAEQGSERDDDARDTAARNEDHPQLPVPVTVLAAIVPAPLPASFGLPTEGLEPGSNSGGASHQTEVIASVELTAVQHGNEMAYPAEAASADPQADLVFALRLGSQATNNVAEPARPAIDTGQSDPIRLTTSAKYQQVEPTPVQLPTAAAEALPKAPSRSGLDIQPASATMATLPIPRIAQQNGTAAEPEPNPFSDGATNKEPPQPSPTSTPQRSARLTQPEIELKPLHEPGPTSTAPGGAHNEIPVPMPGPPHTATVWVSNASMPEPPAGVAVAPAAAAPAPVRNNPASEVTDVSVTVPIPRADSTGEDRVAIRMVQKGAEIHVSVRTPDNLLSQTLRQDLGRLATGLDQAGFHTETWRPVVTGVAALSQSNASQESSQGDRHRDNPGPDARSGGNQGHNPGEQKRRQQDERPRWVAELEQYKNQ